MNEVFISVCSRSNKPGKCLPDLLSLSYPNVIKTSIHWDASSYYSGHSLNMNRTFKNDDDIIVLCHDDISVISNSRDLHKYLSLCRKPGVGIVGVAGCTTLNDRAIWWESRQENKSRGFVFQSKDDASDPSLMMKPNYFGDSGQVVALDGCFMAATYATWNKIGLKQPEYLKSGWDFYDIHLSLTAHLMGLNNYVVPIIVRHGSDGTMRPEWYEAKDAFVKYHKANLPCVLNKEKTNGLPN